MARSKQFPTLSIVIPTLNEASHLPLLFADLNAWPYYFDFKIKKNNLEFRILEIAVALRSHFLQRPYGDQGLLIHKDLYNLCGGFKSLQIMEDLELITRITKTNKVKRIGESIYTDDIKWSKTNILRRAIKNARLRKKWREGYNIDDLSKEYY